MKNPSNACAATEQMLNGSTGRGAKYLLELLLADEQDVKLLWKPARPCSLPWILAAAEGRMANRCRK